MGKSEPRVRPHSVGPIFFTLDAGCERWRDWARGHDRSAEYDGSSTVIRHSWFAGVPGAKRPGIQR